MNSAKSPIGAGDIEAGGHARLCSCNGSKDQRTQSDTNTVWHGRNSEVRGSVKRLGETTNIFDYPSGELPTRRSPVAGWSFREVVKAAGGEGQ